MGVVAWMMWTALSGAGEGPSFSVSYDAAADCPNRATFEAAILARAPTARLVEGGAQVRFAASLPGGANRAQLRAELADGTSQDREIVAEGCAEAMQSMAIIAAMILDSQPPTPTPDAAPPGAPPPSEAVLQPRAAAPPPSPPRSEPPRRSTTARLRLDVSAAGHVESGAAPSAALGGSAGVELSAPGAGYFSPSLRLSAVAARAARVETPAGDARFQLLLVRSHACALRLEASPLDVRACAVLEAGVLLGDGIDVRKQRSQTMPWVGAGLGALTSVQLSGAWALELGLSWRALLVRDEFVFEPATSIHQVPVFAWHSSLGLKLRVW